jgi:hypothetical protein
MGGMPLPTTSTGGANISLYLVAHDTGAEHYIDTLQFQYGGSGAYNLSSGASYSTHVLPGTYDLYYERQYDSQYNYVSTTYATDNYTNGRRVLATHVVIAAGANQLDVDLPSASVTGSVTMGGTALPATSTGGANISLYLVAHDTKAEHFIDTIQFQYGGSGAYNISSGASINTHVLPGVYDLWYERQYDSQYNYVSATYASDNYANGRRVLVHDVTITPGANVLNVDLPSASVTGSLTLNHGPLPATSTGGANISLSFVAADTKAEHFVDTVQFQYSGGSTYTLSSGATYSTHLLPGTYDIWYERQYDSKYNFASETYATDNYANGRRVLQTGVVIASGSNVVNIDLPVRALAGSITVGGMTPPQTSTGGANASLYLVARDTGAEHYIDTIQFQYSGGGTYTLSSGASFATQVLPGAYDLYYERQYDSQYNYVSTTYATDNWANGRRVVGACMQVPAL